MTTYVFKKSEGPPVGHYAAEFVGDEAFQDSKSLYPPGVKLKFKITEGPLAGTEAWRICSDKFSTKSNLGKFAVALRGKPFDAGESIDFSTFIGTRGFIIVEETEDGGSTRVTSFLRA